MPISSKVKEHNIRVMVLAYTNADSGKGTLSSSPDHHGKSTSIVQTRIRMKICLKVSLKSVSACAGKSELLFEMDA